MLPTLRQLRKAQQNPSWDFGNKILYKLCRDNFGHKEDKFILAKTLFIGRIYSAAIERRKNKGDDINDDFYIKKVAPTFRKSNLDLYLAQLKEIRKPSPDNLKQILTTHWYLTTILNEITKLNKRSFSSKYLHFHLPNLFFLYDSRAVKAIRQLVKEVPEDLRKITQLDDVDNEYAKFFCKCYHLKKQIETKHKITLRNRQLDNILIEIANKKKVKSRQFLILEGLERMPNV